MLAWLKWRHEGSFEYPENITPEMVAKAVSVIRKLGLPVEELSPAQIILAEDMTDEEIQKLIQRKESPEPDFYEIISTTPGVLSRDDIIRLQRQALSYLREKRRENPLFDPLELHNFREKLPAKIGEHFDAHGLAKGNELTFLNYLLSHGINPNRPFYTCPLKTDNEVGFAAAFGAAGPYDNGAFIVLSGVDKTIQDDGIELVLVNEHYYSAIPVLQEKFPHIKFIKASEMVDALAKEIRSADESKRKSDES